MDTRQRGAIFGNTCLRPQKEAWSQTKRFALEAILIVLNEKVGVKSHGCIHLATPRLDVLPATRETLMSAFRDRLCQHPPKT